jgi:hypothetical protein
MLAPELSGVDVLADGGRAPHQQDSGDAKRDQNCLEFRLASCRFVLRATLDAAHELPPEKN